MNHLLGYTSGHLGKLNKSGWHLVCGSGLLLSPVDYHAYQLGNYSVVDKLAACTEGFVRTKIGTVGPTSTIDVIGRARNMILNDTGYWLAGNHVPRFISCCGGTALGCFANNTGTNEIAMQAGCYVMVPRLCFRLPQGQRAKAARVRFKGYSDFLIEANRIGSGGIENCAYPMKDFRKNNSVSGWKHTIYTDSPYWDTRGTDLLIAHASPFPDELTIKLAFFSNYWHGTSYGSWYEYSRTTTGKESTVGSSHSLKYYLGSNTHITYNGTFCGAIGTNCFKSGGSSESWDYAYPFCDGNNGTKNHTNTLTGASYGEEFAGVSGTVFKKTGGNFYTENMLNSTARSDSTWLVAPSIELTAWQVQALNNYGQIWVMYSNPSPWFATTDLVDLSGASRQIFVEGCKLEVELE